jgi:acyl-CoA synthetase (NDP forming)
MVTSRRAILSRGETTPAELARLDAQLDEAYTDPASDVVVVIHVPALGDPDRAVARSVARAAAAAGRTTVACIRGLTGITEELSATGPDGQARTVPAYATPEDAVLALAAAVRHSVWRATDHGQPLTPVVDAGRARRIVESTLAQSHGGPVPLDPTATTELLACYGIDVWPSRTVTDDAAAITAAEELGWPVALKATARLLRHRIDLGGVRLDITGPTSLVDAMAQMRVVLAAHGEPATFEVQAMAPGGAACVIRSAEDPRFGPVLSFGLAGDAVDLLDDMTHGVAPLTDVDVAEMVRRVRAAPRLFGYRGLPALDVAALEDVLGRVSVLADDTPELRALELHPVVVGERGAAVLSARVELTEAGRADSARRTLPA